MKNIHSFILNIIEALIMINMNKSTFLAKHIILAKVNLMISNYLF